MVPRCLGWVRQRRIEIQRKPVFQEGDQRRIKRLILIGDVEIQDRFLSRKPWEIVGAIPSGGTAQKSPARSAHWRSFRVIGRPCTCGCVPAERTSNPGVCWSIAARVTEPKAVSGADDKEFGGSGGVHAVLSGHEWHEARRGRTDAASTRFGSGLISSRQSEIRRCGSSIVLPFCRNGNH